MSKTTTTQPELVTVQVTPVQAEILRNYINPQEAPAMASRLMNVCISALISETVDAQEVSITLMLVKKLYELDPHLRNL